MRGSIGANASLSVMAAKAAIHVPSIGIAIIDVSWTPASAGVTFQYYRPNTASPPPLVKFTTAPVTSTANVSTIPATRNGSRSGSLPTPIA